MKDSAKRFLLFLLLLPMITGCGLLYQVLLGVDSTPEWKSDKEVEKQAKKYNIPSDYNLVLDTAKYYHGLSEIYSDKAEELNITKKDSSRYSKLNKALKDDTQPAQFRLFEKNGTEIFKIVNCYLDPPIPMNWNVNGCFDEFPPKTDIESLNSHNYDLQFLLNHANTLDQKKLSLAELPDSDYYGVILWNDFFRRPSRKLIKTVREYIEDSDQSVHLIYINNQNAYLWQLMDSETRERVKIALQEYLGSIEPEQQ
ncbi:MAG TPA: hypothetical protein VJ894_09510 [Cryomorphaceae bacterium]|nr:hypothetical protein [Cryomorphaceae bacterium]